MSGCSSKAATIQKQESKRKRDPDQELYYYLPSLKYCAYVNQILGLFQPMVLQGKVKPIKTRASTAAFDSSNSNSIYSVGRNFNYLILTTELALLR